MKTYKEFSEHLYSEGFMDWWNKGKNVRVPNENQASWKGKDYMYDDKDGRLHQIDEYLNGARIKSTSFWTGGNKLRYSIYDNEENWRSTKWHPNGVKSKQLVFKKHKLYWARGWDPQGREDETLIEEGNGPNVIYNSKTGKKVRIDEYKDGHKKYR